MFFALSALPFAATFTLYYPDERHYTDGAIQILKHGDWLIPQNADGSPRFKKPPLAYWAVAVSYKMFGVGVFASRLPFLLASCGTLFLTFRLARKLGADSETALLAVAVLASNPQFFLCSIRSMPDALLTFFITLSASGFLRLIVFEESDLSAFWMAYGGAAGAVLSKGLLGIIFIGFVLVFTVLKDGSWRAIRKIIHFPILLFTGVFASSWFVYIFWKDGGASWRELSTDQVTGHFRTHFWSPLFHVPMFALILIFNFLPWSATVIEFFVRRKIPEAGAIPAAAKKFITVGMGILLLGLSLGSDVSLRYFLPVTPLFAIWLADCLRQAEKARLFFSTRRVLQVALALLVLADAAVFFIVSQWPLPKIALAAIFILVLVMVAALGLGVSRGGFSSSAALGTAILIVWMNFFVGAMPIVLPDRAREIAAMLKTQNGKSKTVLLVDSVRLASQLRVCLGEKWTVAQTDRLDGAEMKNFTQIVISEKDAYQFFNRGWNFEITATIRDLPPHKEFWTALKSRRLPEMFSRRAQRIILATYD